MRHSSRTAVPQAWRRLAQQWSLIGTTTLCTLAPLSWSGCGNQGGGQVAQPAGPKNTVDQASATFNPNAAFHGGAIPHVQAAVGSDDDWEKELDNQTAPKVEEVRAMVKNEPSSGSPEWMLREIARTRALPLNVVRQPVAGKPGQFENVQLPPEQVPAERLRRSEQIIEMASQVAAMTHNDAGQAQLFNNAIHYLAEARLERALEGDEEQASLLSDDAETLFKRDPKSFAAIETSHRLLQLTLTQSQKQGAKDARWSQALARQARLFAERFPQESSRAALFLITAAKNCDDFGLNDEARSCLTLVRTDFSKTPFAAQAEAMLRRMDLTGRTLEEFAGSTHDGGFIDIKQLRGKFVLIAFWDSSSAKFQQDLPLLRQVTAARADKVSVLGVNFDRDEVALDRFLETSQLDWRHIFYSDPEKRGAENMVAKYYGVTSGPQYWLVGPDGTVRSVNVKPEQLAQMLSAP